ncbi:MAG: hypothetical protein M0R06_14460 [Sphaerochaeta sp.]|jgi:transposase|nr:hypothetical protein [Sphaerochaeta sp.]
MGRPSKLSPEVQQTVCDFIAEGAYVERACQAAGIGQSTFFRWLEQGEKETSGPYREFWEATKKAEATAEQERIARIRAAGIGGAVVSRTTITKRNRDGGETTTVTEVYQAPAWQADAWYLERRYPEAWAKRERHELTGKDGGAITINVVEDK